MPNTGLEDMPLQEIMNRWPQTIRVFLDRRMLCVGCPIAGFHTLTDAAYEHQLSVEELESDILRVIAVHDVKF